MRYIFSFTKNITLFLIFLYQKTLSFDHGVLRYFYPHGFCRYRPTCSEYIYSSIEKFGCIKGAYLGLKRISRCNPWSRGGWDPVR